MSDPAEVFRYLEEVLRTHPVQLQDVRAARTPEEASEILARIAARHGLPTSGPELRRHVARLAAGNPPRSLAPDPAAAPPTEEPTEEPTEKPTAATANGELQEVIVGDLQTFEYSTGLFSIDVPANWTLSDTSKPTEVIYSWTDLSENGALIVDIFEEEQEYTSEELTTILETFLTNSFSKQEDFTVEEPTEQSDGSILLVWSYTAIADNDVKAPLTGNSFIEQRGNKVSILTTLVPSDQFDALLDSTNDIINSYTLDPDAEIGKPGTAGIIGGPSSGSSTSGDAPSTGELPGDIYAVGDPIEVGDLVMTVNEVSEPAGSDFIKPDAGNKFVLLDVSFENTGTEQAIVSTILQMSLLDSDGNKYDADISAMTLGEKTVDGEINAGDTLTGVVGFQVPEAASGLVFVYSELLGDKKVGVALE